MPACGLARSGSDPRRALVSPRGPDRSALETAALERRKSPGRRRFGFDLRRSRGVPPAGGRPKSERASSRAISSAASSPDPFLGRRCGPDGGETLVRPRFGRLAANAVKVHPALRPTAHAPRGGECPGRRRRTECPGRPSFSTAPRRSPKATAPSLETRGNSPEPALRRWRPEGGGSRRAAYQPKPTGAERPLLTELTTVAAKSLRSVVKRWANRA